MYPILHILRSSKDKGEIILGGHVINWRGNGNDEDGNEDRDKSGKRTETVPEEWRPNAGRGIHQH